MFLLALSGHQVRGGSKKGGAFCCPRGSSRGSPVTPSMEPGPLIHQVTSSGKEKFSRVFGARYSSSRHPSRTLYFYGEYRIVPHAVGIKRVYIYKCCICPNRKEAGRRSAREQRRPITSGSIWMQKQSKAAEYAEMSSKSSSLVAWAFEAVDSSAASFYNLLPPFMQEQRTKPCRTSPQ